ncbi:MAG: hypothetical protein Kow00105_11400 [Phycisphaeraceae bacterium]
MGEDLPVQRTIEFAGKPWVVKNATEPMGPGPNYFSADERDVFVDDTGRLHLVLSERDGKWLCAELISDWPVGYGTYEFRLAGSADGSPGPDQLDPNVVLGLFTWDNESWQTDANSEIDVELTRWADPNSANLHYSVHPVRGPHGIAEERTHAELIDLKGEGSTHVIHWRPDGVEFATYLGDDGPRPERLICQWRYNAGHPKRTTNNAKGELTDPIGVPRPHATTTARINLWLNNTDGTGLGDPPTDGKRVEVVLTGFTFTPVDTAETE